MNDMMGTMEDENDRREMSSSEKCNLIINYLPTDYDDLELKNLFMDHGEIAVAKVVKDKVSRKSLGYGFVKFLRPEHAYDAIERKNGMDIGDKRIKVSFARPSTEDIRNCKLYVTNLPKEFSENEIVGLFSRYGNIIECRVLQDKHTKMNRGVAFVQFSNRNEAHNALSLNGYRTSENDRGLVIKYAEDQQKKKERKNMGLDSPMMGGGVGGGSYYPGMGGGMKSMYDMEESFYMSKFNPSPSSYSMSNPPGYSYGNDTTMRRNYYDKSNMMTPPISHQHQHPSMTGGRPMHDNYYPSTMSHMHHHHHPSQHHSLLGGNGSGMGGNSGMSMSGGGGGYDSRSMSSYSNSTPMMNSTPHGYDMSMIDSGSNHMMSRRGGSGGGPHLGGKGMSDSHTSMASADSGASSGGGGSTMPGSVTLYISNLPPNADVATLHELFNPYGRILSAQVDIGDTHPHYLSSNNGSNRHGTCSGRGQVQMASMSQAQYAIQALHGTIVFEGGSPLQIDMYPSNSGGSGGGGGQYRSAANSSSSYNQPYSSSSAAAYAHGKVF